MISNELGTRGVLGWIRGMRWVFGNGGIGVEVFEVCGILEWLQNHQVK